MLRRLCQSVLLSLLVLGLAVPASSHAMATPADTAVPCPEWLCSTPVRMALLSIVWPVAWQRLRRLPWRFNPGRLLCTLFWHQRR